MIRLREFQPSSLYYPRFKPSKLFCWKCIGDLIEDSLALSSGGSLGTHLDGTSESQIITERTYVCLVCKLVWIEHIDDKSVKAKDFSECTMTVVTRWAFAPLVEKDGRWLTPHDIQEDNLFRQYGEYLRGISSDNRYAELMAGLEKEAASESSPL